MQFENNAAKFHSLLSKSSMGAKHPERVTNERKQVFQRLKNRMVILDAEPQIGKVSITGIYFSLINFCSDRSIIDHPTVAPPALLLPSSSSSAPHARGSSKPVEHSPSLRALQTDPNPVFAVHR